MSRHNDRRMGRRTLVRIAGGLAATALTGSGALARRLLLLDTTQAERISRVEWFLYDTGLRGTAGESPKRCALRLTTTWGHQGWADLSEEAAPADDAAAHLVGDTLLGRSPENHAHLWRRLYERGLSLMTLAAVDVALWDLRGRIESKPVHALLGTTRSSVPACVSTGFDLGSATAYADYALSCKERRIGAVKVQPYRAADAAVPDRDLAVFSAVREAVGPEYPCIADCEGVYTFDQALRVGRLLDDLAYVWYGSPMPETQEWIDRYAALASELRTPVGAGRDDSDSYQSRLLWIGRNACDVVRIGIQHGGLTACLELALACGDAGIPMNLDGTGPDSYPYLQLIAATEESHIPYFEVPSPLSEDRLLPGRATPEPRFDAAGHVPIPRTPGMALELDWQYITTHRIP